MNRSTLYGTVGALVLIGLLTVPSASADEQTASKVQITRVDYNVPGVDTPSNAYREAVQVTNVLPAQATDLTGCAPGTVPGSVNLSGWTLQDLTGHTFTFPLNYCLAPGTYVYVRTGVVPTTNMADWWHNSASNLYWNRTHHQYGNYADSTTLEDNSGSRVDRVAWNKFTIRP